MENKTLTIKEVIGMTINDLRSINVPADLLEQMGPPISRALNNLRAVDDVLMKAEMEEANRKQAEKEPQIEITEGPMVEEPMAEETMQ